MIHVSIDFQQNLFWFLCHFLPISDENLLLLFASHPLFTSDPILNNWLVFPLSPSSDQLLIHFSRLALLSELNYWCKTLKNQKTVFGSTHMRWWVAEHERNTSTNTNEITSTDEVYEVHLRLGVLV